MLKILLFTSIFYSLVSSQEFTIKADEIIITEEKIIGKGNVQLNSEPFRVSCDEVIFATATKLLICRGNINVSDGTNMFIGDEFIYNFQTQTGTFKNINAIFGDWFVSTRELKSKSTELYHARDIFLTSCDTKDFHYGVTLKKVKIKPNKHILAKNPVFRILNIPIFYLPYYYHLLYENRPVIDISPSYRNGFALKVVCSMPITKQYYSKFILDYYPQGLGKGAELNYNIKNMRGSLYMYHIHDDVRERWNLLISHRHEITEKISMKANVNFQSDEKFNNLYFTENWLRISRTIQSSIIADYTTKNVLLKTVVSKENVYSPTEGRYNLSNLFLPKILLNFHSLKLPFLYSDINTTISHQYSQRDGIFIFVNSSSISLYRNIRLSNIFLLPRFSLSNSNLLKENVWKTEFLYSLTPKFTYKPLRVIECSFAYNYTNTSYHKTISNNIDSNFHFFLNWLTIRNFIKYDFLTRNFPISTELIFKIKKIDFYIRKKKTISPFELSSINFQMNFTLSETESITNSITYISTQKELLNSLALKKKITKHLFLNLTTRFALKKNVLTVQEISFEQNIDLHCWILKVKYARRHELEEAGLFFELKIDNLYKHKFYNMLLEKSCYPWR